MAGEWPYRRIEEVAEKVGIGPFGSSIKVSTFVTEGIPVISGKHLRGSRLEDGEYNFITADHAEKLKSANVFRGDVIFTHAGNIGQVAYIPSDSRYERYIISQRQFYLRCDQRQVIPSFVTYYFKTPEGQHKLLANSSPSGVPSLAQPVTYLKSITIPVPSLPTQRAIACILGALDDKIELNRRMNETLEAMAQAIFKKWFIEPTKNGKLPEGWREGTINQEFNLIMGQSPPGETYNEKGIGTPFFQGRADFGFRYPEWRVFCTAPTRFAEAGDTLVSVRAPVGSINMARERCAIGRGVSAIRHKSGSRSFTYYFMRSLKSVFARFEAEGTVFGSITKSDFHKIEFIGPPTTLVQNFEAHVFPIDQRIENNEMQSRTLAALRDTLLPKLISGELRVPDAEKICARGASALGGMERCV